MTRGARAAAAGILLLTLAGCSRGEARGRTPLPPLSPSSGTLTTSPPSATPTPTSNPPQNPKSEVVAFVRHYFRLANEAAATGDTRPWRELMTADCKCVEMADYVDEKFAAGSLRGLRFDLLDTDVRDVSRADARLTVVFNVSAYDELDRSGKLAERIPAFSNAKDAMTLEHDAGRWRVASIARIRLGD